MQFLNIQIILKNKIKIKNFKLEWLFPRLLRKFVCYRP